MTVHYVTVVRYLKKKQHLLEEEGGCGYYVMCLECGCQSVTIDFHSEEERLEAAKKTVDLWNAGKVISCNPGE